MSYLQHLKNVLQNTKKTVTIGRSHGIHAEPVTFGLKLAGYYAEFKRNRKRLLEAKKEISTCAISGAVGTFAHIDPYVEYYVSNKLGLIPEEVSTQIIPRDRHAMFFLRLVLLRLALNDQQLKLDICKEQRSERQRSIFHKVKKVQAQCLIKETLYLQKI